ncbi:MAG: redoxin domain-containing protein [Myxococcota bacterium]
MIDVGKTAPNFSLLNTKRELVTLESMRGKQVVLAFFPAAFTGVCEKEMCALRDSMAELNGLNAQVVGIAVDAPFSLAAFATKNNLSFPVLSDYTRSTVKAYGIELPDFAGMTGYTASKRAVFVLDKDGVVRWNWVGPNPGVEPPYEEIKKALA